MSKRQSRSQASSSRAASAGSSMGFGAPFGSGSVAGRSSLSYFTKPPDFTSISDPNVIVAFKNLMKKDPTTKARALEDLRAYARTHPQREDQPAMEEAVLEAWVKLYPSTSIENSRRVRELAHNVQFEFVKSARKRMEKFIPTVVGAWLAGTFDKDLSVSKAATDGITSFLYTEEKVRSFWRRCQTNILEFLEDVIAETPETLSDERTVSAEDRQAKYDRAAGGALSLALNLLSKQAPEETAKNQDIYARLVGVKSPWGFIASRDPLVRRTASQLLFVTLDVIPGLIGEDLESVASAFINKGLRTPQSTSSLAYLQALEKLTTIFPTAWTTSYVGKESSLSDLSYFVTTGSEAGPAEYWIVLHSLITKLPSGVLPVDLAGAIDFLKAFTKGVTSREEAKSNIGTAWICYINVVRHLQSSLLDPRDKSEVLVTSVYPIFEYYLHPTRESTRPWMGDSPVALAKAFHLCFLSETHDSKYLDPDKSIVREWKRLAEKITTSIEISLQASPNDFEESQAFIAAEMHRWFTLQAEIIKYSGAEKADDQTYKDILIDGSSTIITSALETLVTTNGEAYGAAAAVEGALRLAPALISDAPSIKEAIVSFLTDQLPKLVLSPSSSSLIQSLKHLCNFPGQQAVCLSMWEPIMNALVEFPDSEEKAAAVQALISSRATAKLARKNRKLQELFLEASSKALYEKNDSWRRMCECAFSFNCFSNKTWEETFMLIIDALNYEKGTFPDAILALEYAVGNRPQVFEGEDAKRMLIMTKLLAVGESGDVAMTTRANVLRNAISDLQTASTTPAPKHSPIVAIIQESLEMSGPRYLSIETLVTQAVSIVGSLGLQPVGDLFPNIKDWQKHLDQVFNENLDFSLSLTNILGAAVALVPFREASSSPPRSIRRDQYGYSVALRMSLYTTRLITHKEVVEYVPVDLQVEITHIISVATAVILDQLALHMEGWLWSSLDDPAIEKEMRDLIESCETSLYKLTMAGKDWREASPSGESQVAQKLISRFIKEASGTSAYAFYNGRLLANFLANLAKCHGWRASDGDEWLSSLDVLKPSTSNIFTAVALLRGLRNHLASSKFVNNLCNRLLSDISGASAKSEETLPLLLLTNAALDIYEPNNLPAPNNRLVFAVKQIISWMDDSERLDPPMASESCRSLRLIFPAIKDVYGPYWESAIQFCVSLWTSDHVTKDPHAWLPAIHSSLRLIVVLRGLREPNEDLKEALDRSEKLISEGILHLLALNKSQLLDQPWCRVDELIARQTTEIPLQHVQNLVEIYPLLASGSPLIQMAAFEILHRASPSLQEDISVDVLLENKDAKIPEELLSLLLDAPRMRDFPSEVLSEFPPTIRRYLYAWQLIYDSFPTASHKVRSDYTSQLKSEDVISHLFDFIFDVLGHSVGQPLDLERAHFPNEYIRSYDIEAALNVPDEYNMRWLLINLYYLCLKYTPGLARSWYVDCKSKQTRMAVEKWTERHFSPMVIADMIDDVGKWAKEQEAPSEDEKPLIVKTSKKSREVYAGYEVDEMTMQIVIRFLPFYPLDGIKVEGVNRVAVSEKKWQSWLMITQGVITFSNGNVTDGLLAFRRNVTGALKGQTECAICYSIVSSDKKMPDKRCQTCKHLFHSSCLFKWFASSNQSTCPLCRNPFNYAPDAERRARRRGGPEE